MFLFLFLLCYSILCLRFMMNNKLLTLLCLELTLFLLYFCLIFNESHSLKCGFLVVFVSILMVVDSVFSLSILIYCGRSTSYSLFFSKIF